MKNREMGTMGMQETHPSIESQGLTLEGAVKNIIKDIKFSLKTLGIKAKLEQAQVFAGGTRELAPGQTFKGMGDVDMLSLGTRHSLRNVATGYSFENPENILDTYMRKSGKLSKKSEKARMQNIESYLALRKARQDNLNENQKEQVKRLLQQQVEVSKLLKEPNLTDHLGRLTSYIENIIAELETKINNPEEQSEEEKNERMTFFNSLEGSYKFTMKDMNEIAIIEQKRNIEEMDSAIRQLKSMLDVIKNYKAKQEEPAQAA